MSPQAHCTTPSAESDANLQVHVHAPAQAESPPPSPASSTTSSNPAAASEEGKGVWTKEEHALFLEGTRKYPKGPWKLVAEHIGTRNARQTMTHAQKYRQKLARRMRGLRTRRKGANGTGVPPCTGLQALDETDQAMATILSVGEMKSARYRSRAQSPVDVGHASSTDLSSSACLDDLFLDQGKQVGIQMDFTFHPSQSTLLEPQLLEPHLLEPMSASQSAAADADIPWLNDCLDYIVKTFSS